MQQPVIYCPNLKCRTVNPEDARICQSCGTVLPHRYLRVCGGTGDQFKVGDRLLNRYLFCGPQVVLDTQPGIPLAGSFDISDDVVPYLKLFPYRLHLPQIYSLLTLEADSDVTLVLLEGAPLSPGDIAPEYASSLDLQSQATATAFTEVWPTAGPLRQVNWLWQMVQLWTPLTREGVVENLLNLETLRTEGPLVRLLELQPDQAVYSLADLGQFWSKWCLPYVGDWRGPFSELCDRLINDEMESIDPILTLIEARLDQLQNQYKVRIDIGTRTDSGPVRDHNEDACHPPPGTVLQNSSEGLVVVCDGVGGHAGGEVASGDAIATITESLQQIELPQLTPEGIVDALTVATELANDRITQRNDQEHRHDRDRMGTTLVMALAQHTDLYITNLGDSRAYLITAQGCYQITLDDDIASREVRLGYLPYREALRQPGSGSLIQALGMVPSSMLRPAVLRLILDSDCILLLCSDGLSDFERVEYLWRDELLPLLAGKTDLAETSQRLIAAANQLNGHDNVTVGLLHCTVSDRAADLGAETPPSTLASGTEASHPMASATATTVLSEPRAESDAQRPFAMPWWAIALGIGVIGAISGAIFMSLTASNPTEDPQSPSSPTTGPSLPVPTLEPLEPVLASGSFFRVQGGALPGTPADDTPLALRAAADETAPILGQLRDGMVIQVLEAVQFPTPNDGATLQPASPASWRAVKICGVAALPESVTPDVPDPATTAPPVATPMPLVSMGDTGYIQASVLQSRVVEVMPGSPPAVAFRGCMPAPGAALKQGGEPQ